MTPRLHRYLWLLTGRCADFVSPALNTGIRYDVVRPDPDVAAARALLCLGDTATDYYVIGAMAALHAARSALRGITDEESVMFLPQSLSVRAPRIANGELRMASARYPTMLHRPTTIPAARTWFVSWDSPAEVRISTDTGVSVRAPYRHVGDTVYIDWPPELGFHAAFAPTGNVWAAGSSVVILTEPSGYPYAAVVEKIKQSNELVRMMAAEGTLSAFAASQQSLQKVGAFAATVVLRNYRESPSLHD